MKKCAAGLLVILMLVLSACADTAVSYRLADDNTVTIDYNMAISPGSKDISSYTSLITNYWEALGFMTETDEADGTTMLSGTKQVAFDDMNGAASHLASVLTDDDSLFYDVDFNYAPSYFQDEFSLEADVTLENLLRQNSGDGLPPGAAQDLIDQAANAKYTLAIELPGKVTSTNADAQDGQVCIWNLTYGEVTHIQLATTNVFSENVQNYQSLQETHSRDMMYLMIAGGVAGAALIACLLVLILRRGRRRAAKVYMPKGYLPRSFRSPYRPAQRRSYARPAATDTA